jgi:hypothetical protein
MYDHSVFMALAGVHRRHELAQADAGRITRQEREARAARAAASRARSSRPARRPLAWFFLREAGGPA